jgi:IclR family mhp operon transcriptional activator
LFIRRTLAALSDSVREVDMPSFPPVTALLRGLEILRTVNVMGEASVAELHRSTGLHRPTVVRLLETLEHAGYVRRDADNGRYMPTGRALQLGNGYRAHERIRIVSEPILAALRTRLGWPSDIAIPDGDAMLIASTTRAFDRMLMNRRSGTRAPFLGSALGRAYLAFCPKEDRERIVALLRLSGSKFDAVAADAAALERLLRGIVRDGYAVPDPEYTRSVYNDTSSGLAVPVRVEGRVIAALNIVYFSNAISRKEALEGLLPHLKGAAGKIGEALQRGLT